MCLLVELILLVYCEVGKV
uniref:Uncharacterized protein n=1 Tax=Anguilla anguilla TaxID=7936 RepID=A0A0E9VRQ8_ANGAN